jgi:glutathione synthase
MSKPPITVAIQMDHIKDVDINADSTFALAVEAQKRGHKLYHYQAQNLSFEDGVVSAKAEELRVEVEQGQHCFLSEPMSINLKDVDVVLMRQDPPFHMGYITATHILEHVHPQTLVVNDPAEVRNAPEKIFLTRFEGLMPPTLITRNRADVVAFREKHKDIIVKPLYGNGGAGVFHIQENDENLTSLLEMFEGFYTEPYIVQKYLPEVRLGDKRIILVDGEPVGALNRVPSVGEARSNLHVGGLAQQSQLTEREKEICAIIGPELKRRGLIFVGIDVIGNYLTEINVTSPTGIQEISRFDGTNIAVKIWDAIERRLNERA